MRGGLIDLEFIAQFLQIGRAADHPEVLDQNTELALAKLPRRGCSLPAMPSNSLFLRPGSITR